MKLLDYYLNRITMYRLVLYGLAALAGIAIIFGFIGTIHVSGTALLISVAILVAACYAANYGFARLYGATTNVESALITSLILFCIFSPPENFADAAALAVTGVFAMASKYLVAYRARHIFNPAALAAVVMGWLGVAYATWWISGVAMLPFIVILGLLVLRKLRRFTLFISFFIPALVATVLLAMGDGRGAANAISDAFVSWPLLFLGTIMLTEPLTMPPTNKLRIIFGVLTGLLVGIGPHLHMGMYYITPALALVLANVFAYTTTLRARLTLRLVQKRQLAPGIMDFVFRSNYPFRFVPGQYLEVTLPLRHSDSRGNRRSFSIASSPTEQGVEFGVRVGDPASAFKAGLMALEPGGTVYGVQLAGDFTLPIKANEPLAFIAGGIGITPFRSMLQYIIDTKQQRDIVVFYQISKPLDAVYRDVLAAARAHGVRVVYVLGGGTTPPPPGWRGETGLITADMLAKHVPDNRVRRFYVSGPPAMVDSYAKLLHSIGVPGTHIVTDHFSGY
ncbi:MAG TPA: hypothetical protein VLE73_06200 [Candidatus Saccharimonadales bacterium]|nr:hypothetical protein [Candidatus Saccharimonadales bacterium]